MSQIRHKRRIKFNKKGQNMDKSKLISTTIDCVDKNGALPEISDLVQSAGISKEMALDFKDSDEYDNIRAIRKKFTPKRKDGFKSFAKFYAWYKYHRLL